MSDNVYLGNPNLKKANTPIEFTEENVIEFVKHVVVGNVELINYE